MNFSYLKVIFGPSNWLILFFLIIPGISDAITADERLNQFFLSLKTLEANFEQKSLNGKLTSNQVLSGKLYIERPGKFRWDYQKPYEQHIISNGNKIWFYDVDLEQVTVKRMDNTLDSTPAMLLTGNRDLSESFEINLIPRTDDGLDWIQLVPKAEEASFRQVRLGFLNNEFRQMVLIDNLDQTTHIHFSKLKKNQKLPQGLFDFVVPADVDVLDDSL